MTEILDYLTQKNGNTDQFTNDTPLWMAYHLSDTSLKWDFTCQPQLDLLKNTIIQEPITWLESRELKHNYHEAIQVGKADGRMWELS